MRKPVILVLSLLLVLNACKSLRNGGGVDWVTVDFTINNSAQKSALYAVSGSTIETALIVVVPASVSAVGTTGYLSSSFDAQLQDLTEDKVQLMIPLNTSIRLAKVAFRESCTLAEICSTQPTAYYTGISEEFSVNGSETNKTIVINFISCVLGTSSIGSCKLTDS